MKSQFKPRLLLLCIAFTCSFNFVFSQNSYIISTVAGNGTDGFSGDGSTATSAQLNLPYATAVDANGNVYIADLSNSRIRKTDAITGTITTIAGTGVSGFSGDGGLAINAQIGRPWGLTLDASGNLYIADSDFHRIRKIDATTNIITTVAGNGAIGSLGDGGAATSAQLANPTDISVDASGNLYIADRGNHKIRKVDATTGIISTIAGTGVSGFSGDGGLATAAQLAQPLGIALGATGSIYFTSGINRRVRKIENTTGIITTITGDGTQSFFGDGGPAILARIHPEGGLVVDSQENIYIADSRSHRIRKIDAITSIINTIAGSGPPHISGFSGDGGAATSSRLNEPKGLTIDNAGNLFFTDYLNHRVRKLTPTPPPPPTTVPLYTISTFAGTGVRGFSGDGGTAVTAQLNTPIGTTQDAQGNIYIVDRRNHRIRKIAIATGIITTIAGTGLIGATGDGGLATAATLRFPSSIALDNTGNIYIVDKDNHKIRKIDHATGIITTIAGTGTQGFSGDGGLAASAQLASPADIKLDVSGNIYILDRGNHRVRKIDASTNVITTIAGTGAQGFSGDGGLATAAQTGFPNSIALDSNGNIYIAGGGRIRKIDIASGIITTIAGTGVAGNFGDGQLATLAQIAPSKLAIDAHGNIYITDSHRLRVIDGTTQVINTIAGTGIQGFSGDGGQATLAQMSSPNGLSLDPSGNIYFADGMNHRIRKLTLTLPPNTPAFRADSTFANPNDTVLIPVVFHNSQGFAALQLDVEFNDSKVTYLDIVNVHSNLSSTGTFSFHHLGNGKITILWDESSASNVSLLNADTLFAIKLKVVANAGEQVPIQLNNLILVAENGDIVSSNATPGLITVVPPASIAGETQTDNNQPIKDVVFTLSSTTQGDQTYTSLANGLFNFTGLSVDNYTLTPTKQTGSVANGVNVADLILTRRHLLGKTIFNSPFKIIAADADFSGGLNVADIVVLRKLILTQQTTLAKNWRFVASSYTFTDSTNPLAEAFPESLSYTPLTSDQSNQNLTGVKVGDVNRSSDPQARITADAVTLAMPIQSAFKGDLVRLPVMVGANYDKIVGMQGTITFDAKVLKYQGMEAGNMPIQENRNFNSEQADQGMLSFLYDHPSADSDSFKEGKVLFYLTFEVIGSKNQASAIQLTDAQTPVAIYDESLQEGKKLRMTAGKVEVIDPDITIYPNPGKEFNIQFAVTNNESKVSTQVLDLQGRLVWQQQSVTAYPRGQHILTIDTSLPSGTYFLTFKTAQYTITKKLMVK